MANPVLAMFLRPFMQRKNAKRLEITSPDGIRQEKFVKINSIDQWITIRGQNKNNPVLVIVHGGPGSPYTPFNSWLTEWEKHFTIVQWDQRCSGKTFSRNNCDTPISLSLKQLADDCVAVVEYATKRLKQSQVILIGSSVGSTIGLMVTKQRPELFAAYVGMNQNSPGGFESSYNHTFALTESIGDKQGVKKLRQMGHDSKIWTYSDLLAMNQLAIKHTQGVPNMVYDIMLPALMYAPDYKMSDIKVVEKGMQHSGNQLHKELLNFDFTNYKVFDVPFFIIQGKKDYLTPTDCAKQYFQTVQAPKKYFYIIPNAGHLAEFCDTHKTLNLLRHHILPLVPGK